MANDDGPPLEFDGKRVVLLLQGCARGAYQVGAYTALEAACRQANNPVEWVGGTSIGAINAAVIAGAMSGDAAAELSSLWDELLSAPVPPFDLTSLWQSVSPALRSGRLARLVPKYANWMWTAFNPAGQPNFFGSRVLNALQNPWVQQWMRSLAPGELAFYDTERLGKSLDKHVDWRAINQTKRMRLSLGAARVRDGEVVFFNSFESQNAAWGPKNKTIAADHVRASGALPPAFPAIEIDGELYWDGGVSANTPIEELAEDWTADGTRNTLVFLVDLWDRKGPIPRSLDEVVWRQKSIQYGSRKEAAVRVVDSHQLAVAAKQAPPTRLEVCQVMLEQPPDDAHPQFAFADADFSRMTYEQLKKYAALYRRGTHGKHRATDAKYAAMRERKQQRLCTFDKAQDSHPTTPGAESQHSVSA